MCHHIHSRQSRIAIVDANVLARMGLERILEELIPMAEIVAFGSFDELRARDEVEFVHYFVSSRIYFEHTAYFRTKSGRCIVMVAGDMTVSGVATLNVCQGEALLVRDLLSLQRRGHRGNLPPVMEAEQCHMASRDKKANLLSAREVEVALLLCQGCINKEVADRLNIGLTTAITHRKNIIEKLGARSLADVIVYCVMNGIYDV